MFGAGSAAEAAALGGLFARISHTRLPEGAADRKATASAADPFRTRVGEFCVVVFSVK